MTCYISVMVVGSVVLVVAGTRYGSAAVDRSEPENRGFLRESSTTRKNYGRWIFIVVHER